MERCPVIYHREHSEECCKHVGHGAYIFNLANTFYVVGTEHADFMVF